MSIRRHIVLYDDSAAGNGEWFRLDSRYEETPERAIQITVSGGDSVTIQATTKDTRGPNPDTGLAFNPDTDLDPDDITALIVYNADENDILTGNWTYIRVVKAGTAANAKVQGYI